TKTGDGCGCLVVIAVVIFGGWALYSMFMGEDCDKQDFLTKACAMRHLQKPACNSERDILEIDEIEDATIANDGHGNRVAMRNVIYKFKQRPVAGAVSNAVMRDSMMFYKDGKNWKAPCELP